MTTFSTSTLEQTVTTLKNILGEHAPNAIDTGLARSLLQALISQLNWVSREEFNALEAVLLRTRAKLDALEQDLEILISRQSRPQEDV